MTKLQEFGFRNIFNFIKCKYMFAFLRRQWKLIFLMIYTVGFIKFWYVYNTPRDINNIKGKQSWTWQSFSQKQIASMSTLGQILYLNKTAPPPRNKNFKILVHKYGKFLERRHLKNFGEDKIDPFSDCSVQNCHLTYDSENIQEADAVLIHLHKTCKIKDLPVERGFRPSQQRWIFLTDESPRHAFLCAKPLTPKLNGIFNWSMSYRYDADIPVAYGRTVLKKDPIDDITHDANVEKILESKKYLAAIMISNCQKKSLRWRYVKELSKHMPLTILGGCSNTTMCRGQLHYGINCPELEQFKFYLSFENQLCDQYVTEKVWWNAFNKGAIPVVMGGDSEGKTYSQFLPTGSYLSVDDFKSPKDLADCLQGLCSTKESLKGFHSWRKFFDVKQEHAYFGSRSVHYCRVCEALNYNSEEPKVYSNFKEAIRIEDCRNDFRHPFL